MMKAAGSPPMVMPIPIMPLSASTSAMTDPRATHQRPFVAREEGGLGVKNRWHSVGLGQQSDDARDGNPIGK